jgi:hypothetical protein
MDQRIDPMSYVVANYFHTPTRRFLVGAVVRPEDLADDPLGWAERLKRRHVLPEENGPAGTEAVAETRKAKPKG